MTQVLNGSKSKKPSLSALAAQLSDGAAKIGAKAPAKLPVPPRRDHTIRTLPTPADQAKHEARGQARAKAEGRLREDGDEVERAKPLVVATKEAVAAAIVKQKDEEAISVVPLTPAHAMMIADGAPAELMRRDTPAAKALRTKRVNDTNTRKIKNPPDRAKPAAAALGMAPTEMFKKGAEMAKAATTKEQTSKATTGGDKARYDWNGAEEAAKAKGTIPPRLDFSANTHRYYRPQLEEVQKLVSARDLKGLKSFKVQGTCTSPSMISRWRAICITALEHKSK